MENSELDKLTDQEKNEFLMIYRKPSNQLTGEDIIRKMHFYSKIDVHKYELEVLIESCKKYNLKRLSDTTKKMRNNSKEFCLKGFLNSDLT